MQSKTDLDIINLPFLIPVIAILFIGVTFQQDAIAQLGGVQTSGGVNVDGSWYLGEGLEQGNYFEYKLCELDLNDCKPIIIKMWVKGDITKGTETLWDTEVVVIDGNKIVKGNMELGKIAPEPVDQSDNMFHYSRAFKSSIAWLSAFTTSDDADFIHGPKDFRDRAWGKIGAIGGSQLIPKRAETIHVAAGTFDTVVVGWYSGNNNEIWILDNFPFPIKALTYAWVTTGVAPVMYQFALLKYEENVQVDPFSDVIPTIDESAILGCPKEYNNYISGSESTNTFSMTIQYNYSPENPLAGCYIDWKINFKNKYNQNEFVSQVHYDIWVIDENGNKLRSFAEDNGRIDLFNGFGLAHILLPVKENPGMNHYAIFVYGESPQNVQPLGESAGYVIVDIEIAENKNIPKSDSYNQDVTLETAIPEWVKNTAGWWANGQIGDSDFISGIQYLISNGIMNIHETQSGQSNGKDIPNWIKNNAGWWADGQIDDDSFIQGIQFLIEKGIVKV